VQKIVDELSALPDVAYAEPDQILFPTFVPNDTLYSNQWDFFESAGGINVQPAWDITTGSSSVVVAIADTGLTNHADLAGRMVSGSVATSGYDFISDSRVANDGNGRDSNPSDPGDWVSSTESTTLGGCFYGCPARNSSWHGTHVAGTIGAIGNNSLGVAGINWNSKLLIVRVLGKCGGYFSDVADGMTWAAGLHVSGVSDNANPARVINLSLGGSGSCSTAFQNTINAIVNAGSVVVVAAGNSNTDVSGFTPANCNGVIAVAATGRTGSRASYSNYGALVKISAPGGSGLDGILSTLNTGTTVPVADTYAYYQGTSMATPHVTGVVSLMFSVNPSLTPAQVLQILQSTARPFPGGSTCNTSICGSGILDAGAAVLASLPFVPYHAYLPLVFR
jgi:serine protease